MSDWVGAVARRGVELRRDAESDGSPPPDDEQVLNQVIYEAIAGFVERHADELFEPDWNLDIAALDFVDRTPPP